MNATDANIAHLDDDKDASCVAAPHTCTRVAFEDFSGIFLCNDVSDLSRPSFVNSPLADFNQNDQPIVTLCGNLIEPAKQLSQDCRFHGFYTFGLLVGTIKNDTKVHAKTDVPYHLRIAADGWDGW